MDSTDIVILVVAGLILIPPLLAGGWVIALLLLGLWLFATKGFPEIWDWFKTRQSGVSGAKTKSKLSKLERGDE
jgi:hypothetical protein